MRGDVAHPDVRRADVVRPRLLDRVAARPHRLGRLADNRFPGCDVNDVEPVLDHARHVDVVAVTALHSAQQETERLCHNDPQSSAYRTAPGLRVAPGRLGRGHRHRAHQALSTPRPIRPGGGLTGVQTTCWLLGVTALPLGGRYLPLAAGSQPRTELTPRATDPVQRALASRRGRGAAVPAEAPSPHHALCQADRPGVDLGAAGAGDQLVRGAAAQGCDWSRHHLRDHLALETAVPRRCRARATMSALTRSNRQRTPPSANGCKQAS
jgi:hypothetical protein